MENKIDEYLKFMVSRKASDLHLSAGEMPVLRIDGDIIRFGESDEVLEHQELQEMIEEMMEEKDKEDFKTKKDLDFSYAVNGIGGFRVNVFFQHNGIATILRHIPEKVFSFKDLEMDENEIFKKLAEKPKGLVLVTGPTGSGKSTTLAAMIDHINKTKKCHILTIEDPIEFVHKSKEAVINQREVHKDTDSFSVALRAALREDPDVILVGELRDLETIKLALTAAETGHIVFATLHTNSATKTIDRIVDVFPGDEKEMIRAMLSESLVAVISQNLLKRKSGGRIASHEIMVANSAIRNLIREGKIAQMYNAIQTGAKDGMQTMDQSLKDLVSRGIVDIEQAIIYRKDKSSF